ncbi:unnamed protein product [Amoebophrya sp. A25]|nr:unnamed protein product [Amoebophrya sp. A25]|eukprot:GSA25T00008148001.1
MFFRPLIISQLGAQHISEQGIAVNRGRRRSVQGHAVDSEDDYLQNMDQQPDGSFQDFQDDDQTATVVVSLESLFQQRWRSAVEKFFGQLGEVETQFTDESSESEQAARDLSLFAMASCFLPQLIYTWGYVVIHMMRSGDRDLSSLPIDSDADYLVTLSRSYSLAQLPQETTEILDAAVTMAQRLQLLLHSGLQIEELKLLAWQFGEDQPAVATDDHQQGPGELLPAERNSPNIVTTNNKGVTTTSGGTKLAPPGGAPNYSASGGGVGVHSSSKNMIQRDLNNASKNQVRGRSADAQAAGATQRSVTPSSYNFRGKNWLPRAGRSTKRAQSVDHPEVTDVFGGVSSAVVGSSAALDIEGSAPVQRGKFRGFNIPRTNFFKNKKKMPSDGGQELA